MPPETAMILAGGLGTRLRAAVSNLPKVLAVVNGRPFIAYLLDQLADAGVSQVIICTGYMADLLPKTLGESHRGMRLIYSAEPMPLGTGGALSRASKLVDCDQFLALNGDSYCEADLDKLWALHCEKQASGTLLLTKVSDTSRYGRVEIDNEMRLLRFEEKAASQGSGLVNAGCYCLTRRLLESIPSDRNVSLEREVFPAWIGNGLYAMVGNGELLDIGTPESYEYAQRHFQHQRR